MFKYSYEIWRKIRKRMLINTSFSFLYIPFGAVFCFYNPKICIFVVCFPKL